MIQFYLCGKYGKYGKYARKVFSIPSPYMKNLSRHTYHTYLTWEHTYLYLPLFLLTGCRLHIFKINIYKTTSKKFPFNLLLFLWIVGKTTF